MNFNKLHLYIFISINAFCQFIAAFRRDELDYAPVDIPYQEEFFPREEEYPETDYLRPEIKRLLEHWPSNDNCEKCGKNTAVYDRFKNTDEVIPWYKYPWIVALIRNNEIACSGSIISQNFVLTSAECVFKLERANEPKCQLLIIPQDCFHTPGEHSINLLGERTLGKTIKIKNIKPHFLFNYAKKMNNIALIELEEPLKCTPMTSPICLPLSTKDLKFGYNLSIAGWGTHAMSDYYPDDYLRLREGEMVKVETSSCNNEAVPKLFHNQYVCAFGKDKSACSADIGGTAFAQSGKSYYAIGIVSHSKEARFRPLQPITFTNVNHFAGWIRLFVKKFPEPWSS